MPERKVSVLCYTVWNEFHAPDVIENVFHSFEWIITPVAANLWNAGLGVELPS